MRQFEIVDTRRTGPIKIVFYGPEGIGKTTFATHLPDPVFIDTDSNGTRFIDSKRLPYPKTWKDLLDEIQFVSQSTPGKTLVLDTADKAESLAKLYLMKKNNWKAIDSANYGTKYVALADEIGRLLKGLDAVINAGMNVAVLAHSARKKQELPDEMGAFDRWELKLERRDNALLKEWADLLLFANFKTTVVSGSNGKNKATGGERVMYTTHRPTHDAKNRMGLADELPFDYSSIAEAVEKATGMTAGTKRQVPPDIAKKMKESSIDLNDIKTILYQGKFVAPNTPLSQVPTDTWMHIASHWQDAINFLNSTKK